jgi:hypothetical protein
MKFNMDEVYKEGSASATGCGGLVWDRNDEWLNFARWLSWVKYVYSSVVDQVLQTQEKRSSFGGALFGWIRNLLTIEWEVLVKHWYREANKYVNVLPNIGYTLDAHNFSWILPSRMTSYDDSWCVRNYDTTFSSGVFFFIV